MITLKRIQFKSLKDSATHYHKIQTELRPFVEKRIITRFEHTLKEKTGFSDEHRPSGEELISYELDKICFRITIRPTTKRPNYKEVYTKLCEYVKFLEQDCEKGLRREGIRSIDGKPYIRVALIIDKIKDLCATVLEGKEGVSFSIKYEMPEGLLDGWEKFAIDPNQEYGSFESGNGLIYIRTNRLIDSWSEELIEPFNTELYTMTGYKEGEVPASPIEAKYQFGGCFFYVHLEPYHSISYAKIIESLIHSSERLTKKTGELIKIQMGIKDDELGIYDVRVRNDERYISLSGLSQRLHSLLEQNTEKRVRKGVESYHFSL